MTISNVTFGNGTDSVTGAIKEYIPAKFTQLFTTMSKAVSSGAIKEISTEGIDWTCTVLQPCTADVGWGRDFSRWPVGQATPPTKMRVPPTQILAKVALGLAATDVKLSVQERAEYIEAQLSSRLKQMSMHLARGIFGGTASPTTTANWSATAANGTLAASFNDISLFKEGAGYDWYSSTDNKTYTVRCQFITRAAVGSNSANVAGSVTFINDVVNPTTSAVVALTSVTTTTSDIAYQRGTTAGFGVAGNTASGDVLTSFSDLAGTGSLQGYTSTTLPGWYGNTAAAGGSYNQEMISALAGRVEAVSGEAPTHYFCSPQVYRAHAASFQVIGSSFGYTAAGSAATPRGVSASADKYGDNMRLTILGRPLVEDIMCPAATMVAHNQDHVKLAKYKDIELVEQGNTSRIIDQTFVAANYYLTGEYQLVTDMRSSMGTLTGISGL